MAKIGAKVEPPAEERAEPAVSLRRSVRPDHLVCLACGKPQKMLKRHLAVQHGLTPAEYRERFGLKPDYPMAAPNYVQQRREVALATGLGRPKPARRGRKPHGRGQTDKGGRPAATLVRDRVFHMVVRIPRLTLLAPDIVQIILPADESCVDAGDRCQRAGNSNDLNLPRHCHTLVALRRHGHKMIL